MGIRHTETRIKALEARLEQLQQQPAETPQEKRAVSLVRNALARHRNHLRTLTAAQAMRTAGRAPKIL